MIEMAINVNGINDVLTLVCRLYSCRNGYEGRLLGKGSNSISNFDHHNINEGAANCT
jgi:hypothetical protein